MTTPKKCIIKLLQGEPDQPGQSCRFTIDLDNLRITDDWTRTNETFAAPQDIHWLLHKIRIYTVERYQQKKKDEERRVCFLVAIMFVHYSNVSTGVSPEDSR